MASINIKNISKKFGGNTVIQNINMEVEDGEFVVVVGPSGCGKSTLLRMIAGLENITEGIIEVDGKVVNELEPMERNVAMVFQNYALYPHMNVFDNIAYSLKIAKMKKEDIKVQVEKVAKLLQITEYLNRKPRELSGGQRQRVAMGRAIVRKPKLFLFDEPLSNLDAKLRVQMRLEIKKLQKQIGVTAVYVTHDQTEAMTMGDKLLVLNQGKVEQFGTAIELYSHPQTVFVAQFIGSPAMNVISAKTKNKMLVVNEETKIPVDTDYQGDVIAGIRPEHIYPEKNGPLKIKIEATEQLGSSTLMHGKINKTNQAITMNIPGIQKTKEAEIKQFAVEPKNIHLFDKKSTFRM